MLNTFSLGSAIHKYTHKGGKAPAEVKIFIVLGEVRVVCATHRDSRPSSAAS